VAYKVFNAPDGTEWEVWQVLPSTTERRKNESDARASAGSRAGVATPPERRLTDTGPRAVVMAKFENGWLCFESKKGEKRRLVPVPEGWDTASADKLWLWCRAAAEVPKCDPR